MERMDGADAAGDPARNTPGSAPEGAPGDTPADVAGADAQEGRGRLTVQIVGGGGEPERLMHLFREGAEGGRVLVREWSSAWDAARDYEIDPEDLYASLREAVRRGRRVSEELYRVRRWLDGADV